MTVDPLTRASVLPIWTRPVQPVRMEGGLSNISYFVEHDGQKYVARFGRDLPFHHISRARELMVARAAYEAGFGAGSPVPEAGSWMFMRALCRRANGTFTPTGSPYESLPTATWTLSVTGSAAVSSDAAKNDV